MKILIQEIQADIDWRVSKLATIKTLPSKYDMLDYHIETLIWYSIPSIYALWEGFIRNSFQEYSHFINLEKIIANHLDINILTHLIDNECQLNNKRTNFDNQKKLISKIHLILNSPVTIFPMKSMGSNLNYKVTNEILKRFNLPILDNKYKKPLDNLLFFRNHIAHGENSIKVEKENIENFTLLIGDLMFDILLKIEESTKNESYKYIPK